MDNILAKHRADEFLLLNNNMKDHTSEDNDIIQYDSYEVKENVYHLKINKKIIISETLGYWKDKPIINYNNKKYVLLENGQNIIKINKLGSADNSINKDPEFNKEKAERKITHNLINSIASIIKNNKPEIDKKPALINVDKPVDKIVKTPVIPTQVDKKIVKKDPVNQYTELLKKSENASDQLPIVKKTVEEDFFSVLDKNRDDPRIKKFFNYHQELAKKEIFAITEKFTQQQMSRAMESGGGTNAMQFANGGTMQGDLSIQGDINITGNINGPNFLIKKVFTIGNNTDTDYVIIHAIGSKDVVVTVYDENDEMVLASIKNISSNETLVSFSVTIPTDSMRVVIVG